MNTASTIFWSSQWKKNIFPDLLKDLLRFLWKKRCPLINQKYSTANKVAQQIRVCKYKSMKIIFFIFLSFLKMTLSMKFPCFQYYAFISALVLASTHFMYLDEITLNILTILLDFQKQLSLCNL